jgi:hypothetical protein
MTKIFARIWAKRSYIFKLEKEAATNQLHAKLAALHAEQKRAEAEKLNADVDAIEANIKEEQTKDAYLKLEGQEKYKADQELNDARHMIESYRQKAAALSKEVTDNEKVAQHFRREAERSHASATEIKSL